MSFRIVIPARYGSSRLPGKPLVDLAGSPMIQHVWARARESGAAQVLVATDDARIARCCESFGADVLMTATHHQSGTDRIAEVAQTMGWHDDDVLVNLQGDEPLMPAENLHQAAELLRLNPSAHMATLCAPLSGSSEFRDPSIVKVVHDQSGRALYFSRSPIPFVRDSGEGVPASALRHLGLYAYRLSALRQLAAAPPCDLESSEQLEQLRALWVGMIIQVDVARSIPEPGVDSPADVRRVEHLIRQSLASGPG